MRMIPHLAAHRVECRILLGRFGIGGMRQDGPFQVLQAGGVISVRRCVNRQLILGGAGEARGPVVPMLQQVQFQRRGNSIPQRKTVGGRMR